MNHSAKANPTGASGPHATSDRPLFEATRPIDSSDDVLVEVVVGEEAQPAHGRPGPARTAAVRSRATTGLADRFTNGGGRYSGWAGRINTSVGAGWPAGPMSTRWGTILPSIKKWKRISLADSST
jgi:hypothetical protein